MADLISYEELRKIQNAERDNKALQEIDSSFFEKVTEYVATKKKIISENKDKDNTFARQTFEKGNQELANIKKILTDICARRQKKIILQALTNLTAKVHNTETMLPEEEELYNRIVAFLKDNEKAFMSKFKKPEQKPELIKEDKKLQLIRMTDNMPSFMWKDNKTYGPYQKEDLINLPDELGEMLIKQGKAIEIVEEGESEK